MADYVGLETTGHVLLEDGIGGVLSEVQPSVSITSWLWNFGDGQTSTLQNPTHVYAAGGTYTVSLTVTTSDGGSATATKVAYVTALAAVLVAVPGVGSPQGFGAVTTSKRITKTVSGLGSAQQFGLLLTGAASPQTVQVAGISPPGGVLSIVGQVVSGDGHLVGGLPGGRFGRPTLLPGRVTVQVGGVSSAQKFPVTLGIGQIVEVPGLVPPMDIYSLVGGVISGDGHVVGGLRYRFGRVTVIPGRVTVSFASLGLGSAQQFGAAWIAFWQPLPLHGLPSAQSFGRPLVFKVWVRPISCTSLDLAAITCTSLTFATGAVTEITLTAAVTTNLDLTASEAEDLDLQPAGCD